MPVFTISSDRRYPWEAGVTVGVIGGVDQYRTGRTNLIDVTASPYFAAGSITETTGDITSASTSLVVASATSFTAGNNVSVGMPSIQTLTVTAGASATSYILVRIGASTGQVQTRVDVTSGDTATQIATKIRAAEFASGHITTGGSGTEVTFTDDRSGTRVLGDIIDTGGTGVTGSFVSTQDGSRLATEIVSVVGTTITLADAAPSTMTGAILAHDDQPAIQAAVNAATSGDVVWLPAGTYRIDSPVALAHTVDNITIRGAGSADTIIKTYSGSGAINVGQDFLNVEFFAEPSADHFKGDTYINWPGADTNLSGLAAGGVGSLVYFSILNNTDPDDLVVSVAGYERVRTYFAEVVSVDSGGFTIRHPLPFDMPLSLEPHHVVDDHVVNKVGLEGFWIDATKSLSPDHVGFAQSMNCWAYDVKVTNTQNRHFGLGNSVNCEIRRCDFRTRVGSGTNGAGLIMGGANHCLIEDNIFVEQFPHIEVNAGCTANVFAYNLMHDSDIAGVIGVSIDTNHGPHNSFNLYEGNISPRFQTDGYFGGVSEDTVFRNWFHGTSENTDQSGACIVLNRFTRKYNIVGNVVGHHTVLPGLQYPTYFYDNKNDGTGGQDGDYDGHGGQRYCYIFGTPFIGNGGYRPYEPPASANRFAQPSLGDWWDSWDGTPMVRRGAFNGATAYNVGDVVDYTAEGNEANTIGSILQWIAINDAKEGLTTWETPSASTTDWKPLSANAFAEIDKDVINTLLLKGNFNYATDDIHDDESLEGDTLETSMFRDAKPTYFGDREWPPIGSDGTPDELSYESIPAGYRYINGDDPPDVGTGTLTCTTLNVTTFTIG